MDISSTLCKGFWIVSYYSYLRVLQQSFKFKVKPIFFFTSIYNCVRTFCNVQTSDLSLYINAKIVYSFLRHLVLFLHVKLVNIKIETFIIITNNNNNELAFLYLNRMHNKIKEPQNESGTKWKVENFNVWGWYTAVSLLTCFCHSVTFRKQICPIWQFDLNWLKYILNFN